MNILPTHLFAFLPFRAAVVRNPRMIELHAALRDWGTEAFAPTLKREIEGLGPGTLPLDRGTAHGGHVDDRHIVVTVLEAVDEGRQVNARVGVFFAEIIAGCSCGDEPFAEPAYCEIEVRLDKATAAVAFALVPG